MFHFRPLTLCATAAFLSSAPAGLADLTAQQVWESWQEMNRSFGQQMSGTESMDGNVLTVRDVAVTGTSDQLDFTGTLDSVTFTEHSDGTVAVGLPALYPIRLKVAPDQGEPVEMELVISQSGAEITASGTPEDITIDLSADSFGLAVADVQVDGKATDMTIDATLTDIAGTSQMTRGDRIAVNASMTSKQATAVMRLSDPQQNVQANWDFALDDLDMSAKHDLPAGAEIAAGDFSSMMKAGLTAAGNYSFGASRYTLDIAQDGETMQAKGNSQAGDLSVSFGDTLRYAGSQSGINMSISGSKIPFPEVSFAIAQTEFDLSLPTRQTDAPADFGLLTRLDGLSVSEHLWGLFDPAGTLPRDPATLIVDLSGKAKLLVDIFDPETAETLAFTKPGELHAVTINDVELGAAGAELTGTGDFVFDNTQPTPFNQMPKPDGTLNLQLRGVDTLMEKLTQLGLLPMDKAMGARMMLGLFARPGPEPDTLVSEITFQKDGSIIANGQPLR